MVAESVGSVPILVLDDVLSELDPDRANALIANLPKGQVIITSASGVPEETKPDAIVRIAAGEVVES
jgi:DNA replication and repair protein RecF